MSFNLRIYAKDKRCQSITCNVTTSYRHTKELLNISLFTQYKNAYDIRALKILLIARITVEIKFKRYGNHNLWLLLLKKCDSRLIVLLMNEYYSTPFFFHYFKFISRIFIQNHLFSSNQLLSMIVLPSLQNTETYGNCSKNSIRYLILIFFISASAWI